MKASSAPATVRTPSDSVFSASAWMLAAVALTMDLASKAQAQALLAGGERLTLAHDHLWAQLHFNDGAVYGLMAESSLKVLVLGLLAVVVLAWMAHRPMRSSSSLIRSGAALIVGGGLGNLWERLSSDNGVTDFLMLGAGQPWPAFGVFNFADVFILAGCALLVAGPRDALWPARKPIPSKARTA